MPTNKYIIHVKEKGAKKASRNIGGLNNSLGSLGSKAALAAGGFFGAQMLLSGMKSAIDLAGKQELAEKKLETALGHRSQALLNQATALQQVSTFGDEAIIEAQALIAAFVDDEEQIKKATAATLDLAAAKGMDLTVAADLVSKTLGSSTNAMSRYGIEVEGAVGSSARLDSMVTNLADKFGGQASAQAETMSGQIQQMKNAVGDAAEAIGSLFAPVVIDLANTFKIASEKVDIFIDEVQRAKGLEDYDPFEEFKNSTKELSQLDVVNMVAELQSELNQLAVPAGQTATALKKVSDEVENTGTQISLTLPGEAGYLDGFGESAISVSGDLTQLNKILEETSLEKFNSGFVETNQLTLTSGENVDILSTKIAILNEMMAQFEMPSELQDVPLPPTTEYDEFVMKMQEMQWQNQIQAEYNERFIEEYPQLAESMGLVTVALGKNMTMEELRHAQKLAQYEEQAEKFRALGVSEAEISKWVEEQTNKSEKEKQKAKEKSVIRDLKNAALSGQSASQAMKSVVRAEVMEAVAGYISSVLKTVPFPLNIGLAAAGGAVVSGLVDKALSNVPEFAEGFDGVVTEPTLFIAGEAGAELGRAPV